MEAKYIIPLIAVALGWILNEASGFLKFAREERQQISSAISSLLRLYFEQFRINEILTFLNVKIGDDFESIYNEMKNGEKKPVSIQDVMVDYINNFEGIRKTNSSLPEKNLDSIISTSSIAIDGLSKVDVKSAYKARKYVSEFVLFTEKEFPEVKDNPQEYLNFYQAVLTVFRTDMVSLRKLIIRLSIKVGVIEALRIYMLIKSEEKEIVQGAVKIQEIMKESLTNKDRL